MPSSLLFTFLDTVFQQNSESCQKHSDDSALVGCVSEGHQGEYRTLVDNFVEWTGQDNLQMNVSELRKMVTKFRIKTVVIQLQRILGRNVVRGL